MAVGHCWANWPLVDPRWPLHDLWPQHCISLCSGVLPTKFGDHGALLSKLTLLDPSWPLHDLWPQQCITLWSEILPTKFGGHRAFLSNLTPGWPQMTPTWPLTPEYALRCGQGFYSPNLVAIGHSWTIWPLDDLWPVGSRRKVDGSPQLAKPYPVPSFSSVGRSTAERIATQTDMANLLIYINFIIKVHKIHLWIILSNNTLSTQYKANANIKSV